jgi:hypothetical protein
MCFFDSYGVCVLRSVSIGPETKVTPPGWTWKPRAPGRCDLLGSFAEEDRKLAKATRLSTGKGRARDD